jgi:hypothetical protein
MARKKHLAGKETKLSRHPLTRILARSQEEEEIGPPASPKPEEDRSTAVTSRPAPASVVRARHDRRRHLGWLLLFGLVAVALGLVFLRPRHDHHLPPPPKPAVVQPAGPEFMSPSPATASQPAEARPPTGAPREEEGAGQAAAQVRALVQRYLAAGSARHLEQLMSCYAPEVDYLNRGRLSRTRLTREKRAYFASWPTLRYTLVGDIEVEDTARADRKRASFILAFHRRNAAGTVQGSAANVWLVEKRQGGWRIIEEKHRVLERRRWRSEVQEPGNRGQE